MTDPPFTPLSSAEMRSAEGLALRLRAVTARRAGAALALWGEAGIGKTHTVARLLLDLPCRSLSLHAAQPLPGWVGALPRSERLPRWAARLLARVSRSEHLGTEEIVGALGAQLAGSAPFVLHIEDVHEADPERLELVLALARVVRRSRGVALLVTSRALVPEPFESFRLEPLGQRAVEALLRAEVNAALPQEALEWLYRRAAGNPLYTLEYVRFLGRQGYLWSDGRRWHWRRPGDKLMPATVEALIEQLILQAHPSHSTKEALEAAATLPLDAPAALWSALAALPAEVLETATLELERLGLFRSGTFAHPLFREVIRLGLGPARRRELARRALPALEGDSQKAAGFVEDAGLEPEEAMRLLRRAAAETRERGDKARTARFLSQAVQYASGKAGAELALEAVRSKLDAGDAEVVSLIENALPLLKDGTEALLMLAEARALQGHREEMERVLARLPHDVRESSGWLSRHLRLLFMSGDLSHVIREWDEHPRSHGEADPATVYRVAYALMDTGNLTAALALVQPRLAREGLTAEDKAGLLDICAGVAFYQGDCGSAEALFAEALELYRHGDSWDGVANVLRNRSLNWLQTGRYRESLPGLEEALAIYAERGRGTHYAQTLVMISDVYIELGRYERAEEALHEALEVFGRISPQPFLITCLANLAVLYSDWQPAYGHLLAHKHGERCLKVARDLASSNHVAIAAAIAARAAALAGEPARGLELAEEARHIAQEVGFQETLAKAELARGLALAKLGRTSEALAALRKGEQVAEDYQNVLDAERIGLELDRLSGNAASARARVAWFEERGLMNGVNIARRYFPELEGAVVLAQAPDDAPHLEVLGPMRLVRGGKAEAIRGHKRKELLASLLEARIAGRSEVGRLELLDSLYPGEPEDTAADALKQLVFQLRKSLGAGAVLRTTGGYALGNVTSDAVSFLKTVDTRLWRSVYREDAGEGDETVREVLYGALKGRLGELLEQDPAEAARIGQLLIKADPYDLAALKVTLRALQKLRQSAELTRHYREGCARLLEVGELLPAEASVFLASDTV